MSLRVSTLLLSAPLVLASFGCATPHAASSPSPLTVVSAATDGEVVILRERVARLEQRLADVDGKLAALMLRTENGTARSSSSSSSSSRQPYLAGSGPRFAAIELSKPEELPEGLRSTDLGSRGGSVDDTSVDDDGSVVLRMRDDDSGAVEVVADVAQESDNDPLSALTSAKDLYNQGQTRLKEGRHLEAIAAFEDVVGRFPGHDLADNAQYWAGVCHQQRGDPRLAIDAWQKLPARFPRSPKVPDALYGMAVSHEATGEPALAEVLYDEIVASYPKAEKLKEARKALGRLRPSR